MISFDEFRTEVLEAAKVAVKEKGWRQGQAVYNYVDTVWGVARESQFKCGVDCFYDDNKVEDFIIQCYHIMVRYSDN